MTRFCLLAFALAPAMAAVNITTATLPNATVGAPYLQALSASGGPKPYTWTLASGSLPSGLSLSAAGTVAGVPASAGTATFIVQVADAGSATDKQSLRLAVYDPLVIPSTAFSIGLAGTPYSQTLSATGGSGGNVWSLASGSLPPGLALSRAGVVSGTPSAPGSSAFTVQVQDSSGSVARLAGAITIGAATLAVSTSSLPNGTVGAPYAQFLSATGGAGGYSWTVVFGSLPAGLNLAPSGMISGTPSAAGPAAFTVQAMDSGGSTTTRSLGITIDAPPLAITTTSLPNGTVGAAYSQTLFASGGAGGYTWSVIAGSLPPGLSLTSNAIAGTPSSAGSFPFIVQVKYSSGATARQALAVTINPPPLTIATTSLPNGTVGTGYSQSLSASGGTGGYTWSVIAGSLPPGLSLNSNAIGGTPSSNNTFHFTVQVKDSSGATASQALTVTINPPALTIATTSLPNGTVGLVGKMESFPDC